MKNEPIAIFILIESSTFFAWRASQIKLISKRITMTSSMVLELIENPFP
ncbi:MAG: hypothetical protein LUQ54_03395 [Methanoregula sp.]|nr:hypothetical protein [Methanoregula sp.]